MTITLFQKQCKPGTCVYNRVRQEKGTVSRISKDHDKALVEYGDGSREWNEYYLLEFHGQKQ